MGSKYLSTYLTEYSVEIIPLRGEFVNIPCLLRAIVGLSFWKGKPIQAYADAFIRFAEPSILITFIDNNVNFYTISHRFPSIKTIFFQNGTRSEVGDVFESLPTSNKYHVDYMLVHGSAIGKYYQKFISGLTIEVGSLKSNEIMKSVDVVPQSILFISQYFDKPENNEPFITNPDKPPIYWDQFFSAEMHVLKFLDTWCVKNDKQLWICGRGFNEKGQEKNFYSEHLKKCSWEYFPRTDLYNSYRLVNSAEIVVFIDSTLGYESIGRGKKTASFSCRGSSLNNEATKFGWPANLPDSGPFWTSDADDREFQRVMDYLDTASADEWEKTRQFYASELMEYNAKNTRFVALLDQLLSKSENLILTSRHSEGGFLL